MYNKWLWRAVLLFAVLPIQNSMAMEDVLKENMILKSQAEDPGERLSELLRDVEMMQRDGLQSPDGRFVAQSLYESIAGWGGFCDVTPEKLRACDRQGEYPWLCRIKICDVIEPKSRTIDLGMSTVRAMQWKNDELHVLSTRLDQGTRVWRYMIYLSDVHKIKMGLEPYELYHPLAR